MGEVTYRVAYLIDLMKFRHTSFIDMHWTLLKLPLFLEKIANK